MVLNERMPFGSRGLVETTGFGELAAAAKPARQSSPLSLVRIESSNFKLDKFKLGHHALHASSACVRAHKGRRP